MGKNQRVQPNVSLGDDIVVNVITGEVGPILRKRVKVKVFTALLNQSGAGNVVLTVLNNTTGKTVTFTRYQTGGYEYVLTPGEWPVGKTWTVVGTTNTGFFSIEFDGEYMILRTADSTGTAADSLLINTPIELRIYQ